MTNVQKFWPAVLEIAALTFAAPELKLLSDPGIRPRTADATG
jgi:hypothetical protein